MNRNVLDIPFMSREFWASLGVVRALEIRLFDAIDFAVRVGKKELDASALPDIEEAKLLCPMLLDAGYLTRTESGQYQNTEWTQRFLLSTSPDRLPEYVDLVKYQWRMANDLAKGVLKGFNEDKVLLNNAYALAYHKAMRALAVPTRALFAELPFMGHLFGGGPPKRVIDLGCGPAVQSLCLHDAVPGCQLTLMDTPVVINLLPKLCPGLRFDLDSSIIRKPGYIFDASGEYDMAILCNVLHLYPDRKVIELLQRVREKVLVGGGTLVIQDFGTFHDADATSSFQRAFAYWGYFHTGIDAPPARSWGDIEELVDEAGFTYLDVFDANTAIPSFIGVWR